MRADRLLSILMLLQTRGRMTARDLAEQLEVSERTIYRDFEALSIAGIPIYTERGPGGGCFLLDGYQTSLTGLTMPEVQALFLLGSRAPMADLGLGDALGDALLKISASLPAPSREQAEQACQRVYIDASCWGHAPDVTANLETAQQALWQERCLHVRYLADDGSQHAWLLEPYGLVSKAGDWYLVGACQQVYRAYRIARMQTVCLSEERFVRAADFDLAVYWSDYCAQVELNVEQQVARRTSMGQRRSRRRAGIVKKTGFNSGTAQRRVLPVSRSAATKKSNFAVRRGLDAAPQKKRVFPTSQKKVAFSTSRKKTIIHIYKKNEFAGSIKKTNFPFFPTSWLCA